MAKILLASLIGAVVCIVWGALSWNILQWHGSTLNKFADEAVVGSILKADAGAVLKLRGQDSGVFMLPAASASGERVTEESKARGKAAKAARENGPYVYAIVRPGGKVVSMGSRFAYVAVRSLGACFILALLLSWTIHLDYIQRVFFCASAGLFAGLVSELPMLIWFEAPLRHTLINLADHLCEWFLAGLAIAAFVPGREVWEKFR